MKKINKKTLTFSDVFGALKNYEGKVEPGSSLDRAMGFTEINLPMGRYKFANDFSRELIKVDIDFDLEQLGDYDFRAAIEINGRIILVCYNLYGGRKSSDGRKLDAVLTAIGFHKKTHEDFHFIIPIGGDFGSLKSQIPDGLPEEIEGALNKINMVEEYRNVANAVAYLRSGNPDLREYKAPVNGQHSKRDRDRLIQEFGSEDCMLVSWDWKKPKIYHTDGWEVEGHFFWAACGKGREKRVLTWRTGHKKGRK
jgi:hypothetical protein